MGKILTLLVALLSLLIGIFLNLTVLAVGVVGILISLICEVCIWSSRKTSLKRQQTADAF